MRKNNNLTFFIGEKVHFRQSLRKREVFDGVIVSINKTNITIKVDSNFYTVHKSRVRKSEEAIPLVDKAPIKVKVSQKEIDLKESINEQISSVYFSLHGAKRSQERLPDYSPEELEQLFVEAEEVSWVKTVKKAKAFYNKEENLVFITDFSGKTVITTYKSYEAPSEDKIKPQQKRRYNLDKDLQEVLEDLDELDDSQVVHKALKNFKREQSKIVKAKKKKDFY